MTRSTAEKEVEECEAYDGEAWRDRKERKSVLDNRGENGGNF